MRKIVTGSIYKIKCLVSNKEYVGKTYRTIEARFNQHLKEAYSPRNKKRAISRAIRKYGAENFIVEAIGDYEEGKLEEMEIYYIKKFNTFHKGYNETLGGDGRRYLEIPDSIIIDSFLRTGSANRTSKEVGCSRGTVLNLLHRCGIQTKPKTRRVFCKELNVITESIIDMSHLVFDMGISQTEREESVYHGIRCAVCGVRDNYLKLTFKYVS